MATVSKLLIRLQKFSSKISKVIDATDSFSSNNNYYQDLSGWDSAVVQVVGLTGTIGFSTTNDNGEITGQLLPAPEVPINWIPVLGVDLATKTDVSSISVDGIVEFGIIGKYLLLQGNAIPTTTTTTSSTTTTTSSTTTTTSSTTTTTTTTAAPTTTTTTANQNLINIGLDAIGACAGWGTNIPIVGFDNPSGMCASTTVTFVNPPYDTYFGPNNPFYISSGGSVRAVINPGPGQTTATFTGECAAC